LQKNMRFVWEEDVVVDMAVAEKFSEWEIMEVREQTLKENIEKLQRIEELAEKAKEYGVLRTKAKMYWERDEEDVINVKNVSKVTFNNGVLEIKFHRGRYEDVKGLDFFGFLNEIIEYQRRELEKHREYMKEAEKFLVVELEEEEEEDC